MSAPVEPSDNYVAPYTEADCRTLAKDYASGVARKRANSALVRRLLATIDALRTRAAELEAAARKAPDHGHPSGDRGA